MWYVVCTVLIFPYKVLPLSTLMPTVPCKHGDTNEPSGSAQGTLQVLRSCTRFPYKVLSLSTKPEVLLPRSKGDHLRALVAHYDAELLDEVVCSTRACLEQVMWLLSICTTVVQG
jgi:hypothetical protein